MTPPVLFLIFNRPDLVEKSFVPIRNAKPSQLFIAADGPRPGREGEAEHCQRSRAIVDAIDWDCEVKTLFREENLGCRKAVRSAISWFFDHVEEGIILEDDCVVESSFFDLCESLLQCYRHDARVMSICAESFGTSDFWSRRPSYSFSAIPLIWGWATWKRAWEMYDDEFSFLERPEIEQWLGSHLRSKSAGKYWMEQFRQACDGQLNTWDYSWIATVWREGGVSAHPKENLVSNIGCDSRATHTKNPEWDMGNRERGSFSGIIKHPQTIVRDYEYDEIVLRDRFGLSEPTIVDVSGTMLIKQFLQIGRLIANRSSKRLLSKLWK